MKSNRGIALFILLVIAFCVLIVAGIVTGDNELIRIEASTL